MASITLRDVTKTFGAFTAVRRLDLDVADKEFVALLGPSGCGKSTTMNMIAGMEAPTEGAILFNGADVAHVPMGRRGVGFVFQNYAIFTHMSVFDNLAFGLRVQRLARPEVERRVGQMAELLQLGPFLRQRAARLSVNILQRLAIGRSAIVSPAIFLLDEPLSNVDAAFRAVMRTELKQLQRTLRQTMVYVTHDQIEAMSMADRIAVMDKGVLQQLGTPLEVYNHPRNLFVARFIGSPGMTLLDGRLQAGDGGVAVDLGGDAQVAVLRPDLAERCRDAAGRPVVLGVRPEDLTLSAADQGGIAAEVTFVERIGARTIVHLARGEHRLKAVEANGYRIGVGDTVRVHARPEAVRLFDAGTGLSLEAA